MSFVSKLGRVLGWVAGGFFLLTSVGLAATANSWWVLLPGAALAFLVIPATRDWIGSKGITPPAGKMLAVLIFILYALQFFAMDAGMEADRVQREAQAKQVAQAEREEAAKALKAEFQVKRAQILAEVDKLVADKKFSDAEKLVSKYLPVGAEEIRAASRALALAKAKDSLKAEQSLTLEQKASAYKLVSEAEPQNKSAAASLAKLTQQLNQKRAAEREKREKEEALARRKAAIEAQFSKWDGSHPSVERLVKKGMKNPDSYQHVETRYSILPKGFMVVTTIRGTNSFGGVVPQTFRAILDDDGQVVSIASGD